MRYCNLWVGGPIWVHQYPSVNSRVVGVLNQGGWANWFRSQVEACEFSAYGYYNDWWADTEADNGVGGYVPEVYFANGANNQADGLLSNWGIYTLPDGVTC